MADNWIQRATSKNKGAFSAKASAAGMSTGAFASKVDKKNSKYPTKTKRQAALAILLMGFHKRK